MHSFFSIALPVLVAFLAGQAEATTCNVTTPCPATAPCCSEYGFCGKGHFCLGGCNPFASKALDSCKPNPICQDNTFTFADTSRIVNATKYDGNATAFDWVLETGEVFTFEGSEGPELALTLTEKNGGSGTKISSTRYVHYGTISARLKTGKWGGVVTAFITMSDVKDEIDWEYPGANIHEGQSNFFWQGLIPEESAGGYHKDFEDTFMNYHTYTIDWQPDALSWGVDGKVIRTIQKEDTLNPETGVYQYPSTPSRIQLSIWPAGIESSPPGTVQWAGGMIDWSDPDYTAAGQFYATVQSVEVKCNNQQTGVNLTSYVYENSSSIAEPLIAYTNRSTSLKGGAMGAAVGGMHGVIVSAVAVFLVVVHAF